MNRRSSPSDTSNRTLKKRVVEVPLPTLATGIALTLAGIYLLWQPPSADLAAHLYRAWLFDTQGFSIWNNNWYGGHHTVSYSLLLPPLTATVGVWSAGALCLVAASWLFAKLISVYSDNQAVSRLSVAWFTLGAFAMLLSGRIPFLFGVVIGLLSLFALTRQRPVLACFAAALCGAGSPVAALFLAVTTTAYGAAGIGLKRHPLKPVLRDRTKLVLGAALTCATLLPPLALALLFAEGGSEPFVPSAFAPIPLSIVLALTVLPSSAKTLRIATVLYGLGGLAAFLLPTPVGGNVVRLGALATGPVLLLFASTPTRRRILALATLPLLWWQFYPAVRDVTSAANDPATKASYYRPLAALLAARPSLNDGRVEIPATFNHWEAYHAGRKAPLARGWQRQLDRKYNKVFYEGKLTAGRYRRWLDRLGVTVVALPDVRLDYSAKQEAKLIGSGLPYLRKILSNEHWQIFEVIGPEPSLSKGTGRLASLKTDSFSLMPQKAGKTQVKVRFTPYWKLPDGTKGCIERSPTGWSTVSLKQPASTSLTVRAGYSPQAFPWLKKRCFS